MIGQLITKLFTGEASIFLARVRTAALLYMVMLIFALATVGFLLIALFGWLGQNYGFVPTAIGFAIACVVILIGLYVTLLIARRPPRQRAADRMQRDVASIASIAAVSNLPLLFSSVRKRKSLLLLPVVAFSFWGLFRVLRGVRERDWRD